MFKIVPGDNAHKQMGKKKSELQMNQMNNEFDELLHHITAHFLFFRASPAGTSNPAPIQFLRVKIKN